MAPIVKLVNPTLSFLKPEPKCIFQRLEMLYRPNFNSRLSSSSTSTTGRGGGRTGRGGNQDVVLTNFSASATTPTPPQVSRQSLKIALTSILMIFMCAGERPATKVHAAPVLLNGNRGADCQDAQAVFQEKCQVSFKEQSITG